MTIAFTNIDTAYGTVTISTHDSNTMIAVNDSATVPQIFPIGTLSSVQPLVSPLKSNNMVSQSPCIGV